MTRFILIRHGVTDWNVEGRYQGQSDVSINERGYQQAIEVASILKPSKPSTIFSSDLKRARETADAIAGVLELPIHVDPRLREIHLGKWEGMLFEQIKAAYSDLLKLRKLDPRTVSAPGGETVEQVRIRVMSAIDDIVKTHPNETVVLVSHGVPLAILKALSKGALLEKVWDLIPENVTPFEILMDRNGLRESSKSFPDDKT